jgi:hypothetical protein
VAQVDVDRAVRLRQSPEPFVRRPAWQSPPGSLALTITLSSSVTRQSTRSTCTNFEHLPLHPYLTLFGNLEMFTESPPETSQKDSGQRFSATDNAHVQPAVRTRRTRRSRSSWTAHASPWAVHDRGGPFTITVNRSHGNITIW